uniref:Uncharacterized protein n=1 Tax=Mustela putorius furo TaxID=9669 RepID=M3YJJ0_MUSPF
SGSVARRGRSRWCGRFRSGPHPPPVHARKESSSRWEEPTPTPGRARFRHVILSPWAASLGGAKPVREAPGSVAAVGAGETKQRQRLPPARPPSLLPFSPPTRHEHTPLRTPGLFPTPKSRWGRVPQRRKAEAKSENSRGFLPARLPPSLFPRVPCTRSRYRRRRTEVWSTCFWILKWSELQAGRSGGALGEARPGSSHDE